MVEFFLYILNKGVVGLIFTLTILSEYYFLGQPKKYDFYLVVWAVSFGVAVILSRLAKAFVETRERATSERKTLYWQDYALGTFTNFVSFKPEQKKEKYHFEIDFFLLFTVSAIFLGTNLLLALLLNRQVIEGEGISLAIFGRVFSLFFAYSLVLLTSYLAFLEKKIAYKKGGTRLESRVFFGLVFFILISSVLLVKVVFDALELILGTGRI